MKNFGIQLDKYLTTPPDDGFSDWCELVSEQFTDEFWEQKEDWFTESDQANKVLNILFDKRFTPKLAAKVIEIKTKHE